MLLGSRSLSDLSRGNVFIWLILAMQAGILNIAGLLNSERFVSHITGFATQFALDSIRYDWDHALGVAVVPAFFLLGSYISGVLVDVRLKQNRPGRYDLVFGLSLFVILMVWLLGRIGVFGSYGLPPIESFRDYVFLSLLCLVCGLQNATVSTVSRSMIRTSHLTGITTDLGIGLARLSRLNRQQLDRVIEKNLNLVRLGLIAAFTVGSFIGALAFLRFEYDGFLLPAVIGALLVLVRIEPQHSVGMGSAESSVHSSPPGSQSVKS